MNDYARPDSLDGYTHRYRMGCGNVYVTYNFGADGRLVEIFMRIGKSGGCSACQAQGSGRVISIALQAGVPPEVIGKTLTGMQCPGSQAGEVDVRLHSCLDGIGRELIGLGTGNIRFVDGNRK